MSKKKKRIIFYSIVGIIFFAIGFVCTPTEESRREDKLEEEKADLARVEKEKSEAKLMHAKDIMHWRTPISIYVIQVKGHEYIVQRQGGITHTESCEGVH